MDSKESLRTILNSCEYPFTWEIKELNLQKTQSMSVIVKNKLSEDEVGMLLWERFSLFFVLSFEHAYSKDWENCLNVVENCLKWATSENVIMKKYKNGILNVLNPFMAHVHLETEDLGKAKEYLGNMKSIEELSKEDQSAVWALKAQFFLEYGEEGSNLAVEIADKATVLNPNEPWWHFLLGRLQLRKRNRGTDFQAPSKKEIKAFQMAHSMDPCPQKAVYLATSILDQARHSQTQENSSFDKAFSLFKEVLEMYEEAPEEYSIYVLIRCAAGLRKLPERMNAKDLARQVLHKAHDKAPSNAMINHQLGLFYKSSGQYEEAFHYLDVSSNQGCFPAYLALIELVVKEDPDGEGCLEKIKKKYEWAESVYIEPSQTSLLHAHATSYHILISKNLHGVVHHLSKVLSLNDMKVSDLRRYPNRWLKGPKIDIIGESIRMLRNSLSNKELDGMDEEVLVQLLKKLEVLREKTPNSQWGNSRRGGMNWRGSSKGQRENRGAGGKSDSGIYRTVRIEGNRGRREPASHRFRKADETEETFKPPQENWRLKDKERRNDGKECGVTESLRKLSLSED